MPNRNAPSASSTPSALAMRSGATENEVSPSIDSPISRAALNEVMPCARGSGS